MKTMKDAIAVYHELSRNDRTAFFIMLSEEKLPDLKVQAVLFHSRYENGITCPHCDSDHVVRNGHRKDGPQRFLCRDCRRSFLASTDSVVSGTHKRLSVWKKYLSCMVDRKTLSESAEVCGFSIGLPSSGGIRFRMPLTRPPAVWS